MATVQMARRALKALECARQEIYSKVECGLERAYKVGWREDSDSIIADALRNSERYKRIVHAISWLDKRVECAELGHPVPF